MPLIRRTLTAFLYLGLLAMSAHADDTDSPAAAARFLTQATFGPTHADIAHLQSLPSFDAWLQEQFAETPSLQEPYVRARCPELAGADACDYDSWVPSRHDAWWNNIISGKDQLRQRVAFALSQLVVVSGRAPALNDSQFSLASYYDMLAKGAFGNYRDLLSEVTRHPAMGIYLSMIRNQKADPDRNIRPDENFAREVLQLFSIGVHRLNPDGTLQLDEAGLPITTYSEDTIREFARTFTGWNYANLDWYEHTWRAEKTLPMVAVEDYHDTDEKVLLDRQVVPAGLDAAADLDAALDIIFQHPNVGPFLSKLLIQRLVTSNPTPGYVQRVSAVFDDNGSRVRGDLKAVVRAILLDTEARNGHVTLPGHFGKLREPLLKISHLMRAFQAAKMDGGEWGDYPGTWVYRIAGNQYRMDQEVGQGVLRSPSVFNFFQPDYAPAGPVRSAGLVSPEFQILTDNNLASGANIINAQIHWATPDGDWASPLDFSYEADLAVDTDALLDHLDILLMNGQMRPDLRDIIDIHLAYTWYPEGPDGLLQRARDAVSLVMMSPAYQVQR